MSFKTTLSAVKAVAGIPDANTSKDALIQALIDGWHAVILEDIGGGLTQDEPYSYTMKFDIPRSGLSGIRLPKWPVTAITSVSTGTTGGGAGSALASTAYYATANGTLRLQGSGASWPVGVQNVTVVWSAGIAVDSNAEASLEIAERLTVAWAFAESGRLGLSEEQIGDYSYKREGSSGGSKSGSPTYPATAEAIIARYRSIFPAEHVVP